MPGVHMNRCFASGWTMRVRPEAVVLTGDDLVFSISAAGRGGKTAVAQLALGIGKTRCQKAPVPFRVSSCLRGIEIFLVPSAGYRTQFIFIQFLHIRHFLSSTGAFIDQAFIDRGLHPAGDLCPGGCREHLYIRARGVGWQLDIRWNSISISILPPLSMADLVCLQEMGTRRVLSAHLFMIRQVCCCQIR